MPMPDSFSIVLICCKNMDIELLLRLGTNWREWPLEFRLVRGRRGGGISGDLSGRERRPRGSRVMRWSGRFLRGAGGSLKRTELSASTILTPFARGKGLHAGWGPSLPPG